MCPTHLSGAPALPLCNFVPLRGEHGISGSYSSVLEPSEMPCMCVQMLSMPMAVTISSYAVTGL